MGDLPVFGQDTIIALKSRKVFFFIFAFERKHRAKNEQLNLISSDLVEIGHNREFAIAAQQNRNANRRLDDSSTTTWRRTKSCSRRVNSSSSSNSNSSKHNRKRIENNSYSKNNSSRWRMLMKIGISSNNSSESGRIRISTNRRIAEEAAAKETKVAAAGVAVEAATDRNLSATDA